MSLFGDALVPHPHKTWGLIKEGVDERSNKARALCNELYQKFSLYSDSDFVQRFHAEFFQRFWEMDLACTLIDIGKDLSEELSGDEGPDICIRNEPGRYTWIEAICPERGNTKDRVTKPVDQHSFQIDSKKIILRITNAIATKHIQHQRHVDNGICSVDAPFIIAINGCQLAPGPSEVLTPRIVKAVFEGGDDVIQFDSKSGRVTDKWCENRRHIEKHNKEKINPGYFMQEEYSSISAVLYSDSCYSTRPSEAGEDYVLVHNPFANNPLREGFLGAGLEYSTNKTNILSGEGYPLNINSYRRAKYLYSAL